MPDYFPEIDKPLWSDTEVRSLQKIAGRLDSSIHGDLFGRTKVSQPVTLFDSSHVYQDNGLFSDSTQNPSWTGTTLTYDITGTTGSNGGAGTSDLAYLSGTNLTAGSGTALGNLTSPAGTWNRTWPVTQVIDAASALSGGYYFQWTTVISSGYKIDFTNLSGLSCIRTTSGPQNAALYYSTDGVNFTQTGSIFSVPTGTAASAATSFATSMVSSPLSFDARSSGGPIIVTWRIVAWGNTGSGRIGFGNTLTNDFQMVFNALGSSSSVSYSQDRSTAFLNIGTDSGGYVYRESSRVFTYQPGKSLQVMQTFVFNQPKTNLRQRVGYFSSQNGFFLEQNGTNVYLTKRSFITGSVVETQIPQSSWNLDPLDGTGPSRLTLDLSKAQILFSEYEWLGVGSVVMGFVINGSLIAVHKFDHANIISSVYITTATLPIRYEIENFGGNTASSSTMQQICATVISNGGYEKKSIQSVVRRTTAVSASVVGTIYPILSIRLASDRLNAVILPAQYHLQPTATGKYEFFLIKNGTLTGASFNTTDFPNVDYDISATGISGGTIVDHGYFDQTAQASAALGVEAAYNFAYQLGRNSFTSTSDILTLAFATSTSGGAPAALGSLAFFDLT